MQKETDLLFQILEDYLYSDLFAGDSESELIARVADAYLAHLLDLGTITEMYIAEVREDIEVEVRDMYLKKTYGHFSLKDFRRAKPLK